MVENKNEINFDENKPYLAPHWPITLEGHWQPWYDDRRDYNTNAPTYYDYLSNFNKLIKDITELLNRVARRNIQVEDTNCIDFTKVNDWIDEGGACHTWHDVITLKAEVILSTYQKAINFDSKDYKLTNSISCLTTGLYAPDYLPLLKALADKLNKEIGDRIEGDNNLSQKIEEVKNNLQNQINNLTKNFNDYKKSNDAEVNKLKQEVTELKGKVVTLTDALQKIVTNLHNAGNATTNDINTYQINNSIACGNINVYGGTAGGSDLVRTHTGNRNNDIAIGHV